MKIKVKIKPLLVDEGIVGNRFKLKVYFKEENQWFNRTIQKTLLSTWHDDLTYAQFINQTFEILTNEKELINIAKAMVVKYYNDEEGVVKVNNKEKQIKKIINKKEITFEMEIKE